MKGFRQIFITLFLLTIYAIASGQDVAPSADATQRMAATYLALPLAFEANQGQVQQPSPSSPAVDFLARGSGYTLFLTQGHAVIQLSASKPAQVLQLNLAGSHANPKATGISRLARQSHYLLGLVSGHIC